VANWLTQLFGSRNQRILHGYSKNVDRANALEESFKALDDDQLRGKTAEFRARLGRGELFVRRRVEPLG
jgi:preprotein translocase subunit SecA